MSDHNKSVGKIRAAMREHLTGAPIVPGSQESEDVPFTEKKAAKSLRDEEMPAPSPDSQPAKSAPES